MHVAKGLDNVLRDEPAYWGADGLRKADGRLSFLFSVRRLRRVERGEDVHSGSKSAFDPMGLDVLIRITLTNYVILPVFHPNRSQTI